MVDPDTERFVSPDGGRDSMSIIHSCLWTLILCIWSSLHPNIPAPGESEKGAIWHRVKWMLASIMAPEYVAVQAIRDWYDANWSLKQIRLIVPSQQSDPNPDGPVKRDIGSIDVVPLLQPPIGTEIDEEARVGETSNALTEKHLATLNQAEKKKPTVWFARKKSIGEESDDTALSDGLTLVLSVTQSRRRSSTSVPRRTVVHAYYVCMGGFYLLLNDDHGRPYRLDACQFMSLLKRGDIQLPVISAEEIQTQPKSDVFAKAWALVQIFWLIAYLITRTIEHLPVTILELFAAGQVSEKGRIRMQSG